MTAIEHDNPRTESRTTCFRHDWDGAEPLSVAVAAAIAELSTTEPTDLEVLYERVDPDALEALFEPRPDADRTDGHVQFSLSGCEITVYGDGFTVVRRLE